MAGAAQAVEEDLAVEEVRGGEARLLLSVGAAAAGGCRQLVVGVVLGARSLLAEEVEAERLMLAMGVEVAHLLLVEEVGVGRLMLVEAAARLLQVEEVQAVRRCLAREEVLVPWRAGSEVAVRSEEVGEARKRTGLWEVVVAKSWEPGLGKEVEGGQDHDSAAAAAAGRFSVLRMEEAHRICAPALSILRQELSGAVVEVVAQGRTAQGRHAQACRRQGAAEARGTSVSVVSPRAEGRQVSQPWSARTFLEREGVVARRLVVLLEVEGAP